MANKRAQGTIFVDTTDDLGTDIGLHLIGIKLRATSANATLTLREVDGSGNIKWIDSVEISGRSGYTSLKDEPIQFNSTMHATITNGEAILIVRARPPSENIFS